VRRDTWRAWAVAGGLALGAVVHPLARGADPVRVGDRPAVVRERPSERAAIVLTVAPGSDLLAFDREQGWVWVVALAEGNRPTRAGWINQKALTTAARPTAPNVASAAAASVPPPAASPNVENDGTAPTIGGPSVVAADAEGGSDPVRPNPPSPSSPSSPPAPVGGVPNEARSSLGDWVALRALRGSFGFNYQSVAVRQTLGGMDERLRGGVGTIAASLAILDPRILTIDFAGDLQLSTTTSRAPLASFTNTNGLSSYRLDFGVLTGRNAPIHVFADRVSSVDTLVPSGETLDPARRTHGVRSGLGFTWDINSRRLPHIQVSASTGRQSDDRNYLFGYSSTNVDQRAEVRASREYARGRYDLNFTHGNFVYDVPGAGVRSETSSDIFQAAARLTPSSRLSLDLHARATAFRFGTGSRDSQVSGAGADVAARYKIGEHLAAAGRYSFSNNAFEAALSGQIGTSQPGATPVTAASQLQERTQFHDGEARLEYSTRPFTVAAVTKTVSFGVPAYLADTLSELTTAGGLLHMERTWHGLSWQMGGDAQVGQARSNRSVQQPYREAGATAGINRNMAGWVRFGVDASVRRVSRLTFFPVNLDARHANLHIETTRPGWARLRATVTRFDNLRDVLYSDSRDRHTGYSLGLAGGRYDVSVEIDQTDTHSLLLAPSVLGSRPDVAILIASRPDLFGNLLAAGDHSRALSLQLRPLAGLQLEARARRQEQVYPGVYGVELKGAQAWASYQIRDLQLEFGWEYFDSSTSFGHVSDRRIYARVRRHVTIF
jgi:hypothetical protein